MCLSEAEDKAGKSLQPVTYSVLCINEYTPFWKIRLFFNILMNTRTIPKMYIVLSFTEHLFNSVTWN